MNLKEHLGNEGLERRYREAKDPVLRSHYHIVWLLWRGRPTRKVVEVIGYSPNWVRQVARRYNEGGPEGLGDRRHNNPGGVHGRCSTPKGGRG